jgi:uncharacterized protein YodC (DUF2158 family)
MITSPKSFIMEKFQPGDVVELKSGGPQMTIVKPDQQKGDDYYLCTWFKDDMPQYNSYPAAVLDKYTPGPEVSFV